MKFYRIKQPQCRSHSACPQRYTHFCIRIKFVIPHRKKLPYIIHRTSLGCYERTLAYLLETYAGALPAWLSPEQVRILTITDRAIDKANEVYEKLTADGYRVSIDDSANTLKYKVRNAQLEKVPYMIIAGEKEMNEGTVAVRSRKNIDLGAMAIDDFLAFAKKQIDEKDLTN